jgi:hypothetical protein
MTCRVRSRLPDPAGWAFLCLGAALLAAGCGKPTVALPAAGAQAVAPPAVAGSRPSIVGDRLANVSAEPAALSRQSEPSPFRFEDVTKESGIEFVHVSGMTPEKHFPTANGSGVAMFDYDGDGLLDLYFATATPLPVGSAEMGTNRLYKNRGGGRFADVTASSGLGFRGFCHGVVVGDVDNDGDQDVFLCNYGTNKLYANNGDGTFADVSARAGIDRPGWSSGGAFLDYDGDGDLDLYVANYGQWTYPDDAKFCGDPERKIRLYCSPRSVRTVKHYLYRNNGDGTFTDAYDQAIRSTDPETGRPRPRSDGHGFGVVAADLDGDGRVDLYVANDMNPNFVFLNNGDGTFRDATDTSGAAYDERGQAQSGMGVDAEDVDGDGRPELFVTNFASEYNTLYQNMGNGSFMDVTPFSGMAADTRPWVGWGTALADFDNDGWPDNFVANGHVDDNRRLLGEPTDYAEPPLLFLNLKGKRFRLATRDAGPYFEGRHVGRGVAFGDLDNDGDIDVVVSHKDGLPAVLRNDTQTANHWVRLELRGTRSNRDAVGARVEVVAGGRTIARQRKGGVSMLSAHDPRLTVGLGAAESIESLTVRWPSGAVSALKGLGVDRAHAIVEPPAGPERTVPATKP